MKKHLHYEDASAYIDYLILLFLIHISCICAAPRVTSDASTAINDHKVAGFTLYKQQVSNKFHFWPLN